MTTTQTDIFDLSDYEEQALAFLLKDSPASLAQIAWYTEVPRTSMKRALYALKERGLVEIDTVGKRDFWKRTLPTVVVHDVLHGIKNIGFDLQKISGPGIRVVEGVYEISQELLKLLQEIPHNGELNGIQPTESAILSTQKIGLETIHAMNKLIKKKRLVVRGVLGKEYPKKLHNAFGNAWLESFLGRTAHFVLVPEEYLSYNTELYLTGKQAFVVNWNNEVAIVVDDTHILSLLTALYRFMHNSGERIKHEEFTSLLEKIN